MSASGSATATWADTTRSPSNLRLAEGIDLTWRCLPRCSHPARSLIGGSKFGTREPNPLREIQIDFGATVPVLPLEREVPASGGGDGRPGRVNFAWTRIIGFIEGGLRARCAQWMPLCYQRIAAARRRHVPKDLGVGVETSGQWVGEEISHRDPWRCDYVGQEGWGVDGGPLGQRTPLVDRGCATAAVHQLGTWWRSVDCNRR